MLLCHNFLHRPQDPKGGLQRFSTEEYDFGTVTQLHTPPIMIKTASHPDQE